MQCCCFIQYLPFCALTINKFYSRDFGPKVLNLKLLVKKLQVLIEDRDKGVREETKKLIVEFYRWIGAGFKTQLSSVRPVVVSFLRGCAPRQHDLSFYVNLILEFNFE